MKTPMKEVFSKINKDAWIISDTHFGHKNILEFEPCRLTQMRIDGYEADEHEKWIIEKWNSIVKPDDNVLHLGDFAFKGVQEVIEKLNGNITLILGNHDGKGTEQKYLGLRAIQGFYFEDEAGFINKIYNPIENDRMLSGLIKVINGEKYMFCHYDIFTNDDWDRKNKKIGPRVDVLRKIFHSHNCDYLIHGHTHSQSSTNKDLSINVCFEQIDFQPQKLSKILV